MLIFLNGRFVPEADAVVSVFDRSFLYGDGLFETMRVFQGRPFRWKQHLERLERGAAFLGINIPFRAGALAGFANELIERNRMPSALLRLTLSRGVGVRGYSPKGADSPTLVMTLHPAPPLARTSTFKLITSSIRLPANDMLSQFKTCNKLPQILARAETDRAQADEGLLLNTEGFVVEGATSNLFWIESGAVCTPPLASGILPGVTRAVVLEICETLGLMTREVNLRPAELRQSDAVLVSLSSLGVIAATSLDGIPLKTSLLAEQIRRAYFELLHRETGTADSSQP